MQPQIKSTMVNLNINAIIGINDYERIESQSLHMILEVFLKKVSKTKLSQIFNELVRDYCQKNQPLLLEKMAYDLAQLLIKNLETEDFKLTIEKPQALKDARCSFVSIYSKG